MTYRVLVTGGAGFVGSNLAMAWKRDDPGAEVCCIDSLHRRGSELNVPRLRDAGVAFIHGDLRQPADLQRCPPPDLILDCAAEPSVLAGTQDSPRFAIDTNLMGTVNCLELARQTGADMVFLSTSRVYPIEALSSLACEQTDQRMVLERDQPHRGASDRGISEAFPLEGHRTVYGATKLASELMAIEYAHAYDIRCIINRCGVIAGPWQMGKVDQGFLALWVARHVLGGELSYIGFGGHGKQVRDILHVADLYQLLRQQLTQIDKHNCEIFNVGGGVDVSVSLKELTDLCVQETGRQIPIQTQPETRTGDIPVYISDCRKVQEATGWKPTYTTKAIVADVHRWIRDNENTLRTVLA